MAEKHDGIRHADRDNVEERGAAQRRSIHGRAGQNAERACTVSKVGQDSGCAIGGVIGGIAVDEIPLEILAQELGQGRSPNVTKWHEYETA